MFTVARALIESAVIVVAAVSWLRVAFIILS